jgi:peptidoglycan-associated lipoprotein
VPESSIRTVSLGEEGALCIDNSDVCRQMNRRVHVEMRKIGQAHMVLPPLATEPAIDSLSNNLDLSAESGPTDSSGESLSPSASDPAETTAESTTGN